MHTVDGRVAERDGGAIGDGNLHVVGQRASNDVAVDGRQVVVELREVNPLLHLHGHLVVLASVKRYVSPLVVVVAVGIGGFEAEVEVVDGVKCHEELAGGVVALHGETLVIGCGTGIDVVVQVEVFRSRFLEREATDADGVAVGILKRELHDGLQVSEAQRAGRRGNHAVGNFVLVQSESHHRVVEVGRYILQRSLLPLVSPRGRAVVEFEQRLA